ncbi:MAG: rhodanese-like domain-containing protein [Planctomycetota bacterium]|jgi:adenylyltransferase/sulfurtransferase
MNFNISPEELRDLLAQAKDASERPRLRLIDVREPEEHEICALPGAELCPMSEFSHHQEGLIDSEETLVVYCHHGIRSAGVVNQLRYLGQEKVLNLAGGIDRWSTEVDPTVPRYGHA